MPRITLPRFNTITDWDFCQLCNGFDTIMNYVPITKKYFARICEKCFAKYSVDEIKTLMLEKKDVQ